MATITLKGLAHSYLAQPRNLQMHPQDYAIQAIDHVWKQGGAYALPDLVSWIWYRGSGSQDLVARI